MEVKYLYLYKTLTQGYSFFFFSLSPPWIYCEVPNNVSAPEKDEHFLAKFAILWQIC